MWTISGEDHVLSIDFLADGEFVIPEAAWLTLRGQVGTVLLSNEVLDTSSTHTTFTIPGTHNTITSGASFENRFAHVTFNYLGRPYQLSKSYQIGPFVPMTTTPADVRNVFGLDTSELLDRDVNLLAAYLELEADYGEAFTEALSAGGLKSAHANKAIALKAALALIPSLRFRAGVKWSGEESQFQRQGDVDLYELEREVAAQLASSISIVTSQTYTPAGLFSVATPTDAVTGE